MDVLSKVVVFIKSCKKLNGSERYEVKSSDVHRIELQGRNSSITSEKKYENVYNDDNLVKTDPVETSHQNMIKLSSHSKYSKPIAPLDDIQNFTSNGSCEKNVLSAFENELKEATNNSVMLDSVLGCGNIYHLWPKKQRVDKNAWNSINQLQCNQGSKDSKNPLDKTVITKQITGSCCYGLNLNSLRGSKIPCLTNSTVYLNYVNRQKISQNKTLPALSSSKHRAKPTIGKVDNHVLVDIKQEGKNKSKFQSTRSNSSKSRIKEPFIVFIKGRSRSNEEKSSRKKKLSSFGQANLNGNEVMVNRCLCHTCKCRQHSEEVLGSSTISSRSDTPPKPWAFTLRSYDKSPSPICSRKSTPEKPANHQSRMRIKPQKNLHHSVLVKDVSQTEIKYKPPFLSYTSTLKNLSNYDMMLQNRLNNSYEMPGKFMKPALNNYKYKLLRSQKTEVVSQSISSHQNLPMYHNPHLLESTTVSSNSVKTNSLNKIQRTLHQPLLSNLPLLETKVNFKIPEVSTFPRIKYKLKLKNKLGNDLTNNYLRNCGKNNFSKKGKETVIDMKTDKDAVTVSKDKKFEINPSNNGKALDCLCPDMSMHTCSSLVMEQNSCNSSKQKVNNHQDCLKKQTIMEVVDGFFNKYDNSDQSIYARTLKILKKSGYYAKFIDNLHVIDQYGFNLNNVLTSLISQKYLIGESKSQQLSEPLYQIGNIYVKQTADVIEEIENNKKIYFDSLFAFTPSSENCKIAVKCHKNQLENNEKLFWYDSNLLNNKESMSFIYDTESKNESNIGNLNSISNVESVSSQLDCTNHITSASLATLDSDFDIFESSLVEFEAACPSHLAKELEDISYKSDSFLEDQDVYKSKKERRYLRDAFKCIQTNPSFQSNFELCHPSKIKQKRLLGSTISVAEKQRSSKVSGEASAASCGPPDVNKTYHSSNSLPLFKKCSMLSKSFQNMCIPMFRQRSYSKSGDTIKKSWQSLTIAGNVQSQRSYSCFGQTSTYSPDSDQDISISTNSSFKNKSFSKYSDRDSFFSSIFASPRFKKKIRKSSLFSDSNPFEIQHTSSIDPNTLSYPLNDRKSSCLSNSFSAAHDEQEEIVNVNKYKKYHHTYRSGYSSTSPIPPLAVFSSDEDISIYPLRHVSSEPNYNTVESDNSFKRLSNLNRSHQVDTSLRFIDNKFIINRGAVKYYDNLKSSFPVSNLEWKRDLQCRLSYSRPVIKKYSAKDISCCHQKGSSCSCLISSDQFIKMMSQPYLIKAREWFSSDIYSNRLFFSLPNISAKDIGFISSNLSLQSQVSTASTRFPISSKNNSLSSNEASSNNISSLSWSLVRSKGSQNTYVEALWDFVSLDREELTFYAGDIIMVVEFPGKTWWWGKLGDKMGWFPSSHVIFLSTKETEIYEKIRMAAFSRLSHHNNCCSQLQPKMYRSSLQNKGSDKNNQDLNHCHIDHQNVGIISIASSSSSSSSYDLTRRTVMNELMKAERDYVKHLKDIVEGYLRKCEEHKQMFTPEQISKIFCNIEDINNFSNKFLEELKVQIIEEMVELSCIGKCFIKNKQCFEIYSNYCNNHSIASQVLLTLRKINKYQDFFENCRKEQNMIEIPLEGFLLTPIQKICKYPLQLKELLRFTAQHHKDYDDLKLAIDVMRNIVSMINERKRSTEERQNLLKWQNSIINWQGTNITDLSTELIHSGELVRVNSRGWHQQRFCFLFDHQMVLCKKDLPWKALLVYKGRIDMDVAILQEDELKISKNSFMLLDKPSGKMTIWLCKSPDDLKRWIEALRKERFTVKEGIKTN